MNEQERKKQQLQDAWRHAIDRAQLGLWDWNLVTDDCFYSASWFKMLGYCENEFRQESDLWLKLTHPDDRESAILSGQRHLAGETGEIETELRLRHRDGSWVWVLDRGGVIEWDEAGRPLRAVGVQTDITRQKRTEEGLAQANTQIQLALDASSVGIWQYDPDTQKSYWDNRTREIFGLEPGEGDLPRDVWHAFLHPDDKESTEQAHAFPVSGETPTKVCYRIVRRDGTVRHIETLFKLHEVPGITGRLVGTIRDITEEYQRQHDLAYAASRDVLTGLVNRATFADELARCISRAGTQPFAVYYIDLDYFKALNDTLGHAAGDAALKSVATRVQEAVPMGTMARLGGDEFALALQLSDGVPKETAQKILRAIQQTSPQAMNAQMRLGASIGVTVVSAPELIVADVLARADDACYAAKTAGRNRWVLDADLPSSSGMTAAALAMDLTSAMEDGRLMLYGQELRALSQPSQPTGMIEVLARMTSRDGKFIPPAEFVPAAERFGMAAAFDRHVIRTALRNFGHFMGGSGITLGFNLSAHTMSDPMLWEFIETTAAQAGAPLENIVFEITETAAFTNVEAAECFVKKAQKRHCRVSLDDFGAGFSSFAYLRRFPVNSLKIDGSFVEKIEANILDREIVKSISGIGDALNISVVAERIETAGALSILQDLGVTLGQGYLLHRPEPLTQIIDRLTTAKQIATS
ncbi:MAG: EAL domain-containing protein [Pseudomonas sp.]